MILNLFIFRELKTTIFITLLLVRAKYVQSFKKIDTFKFRP